MSRKAKPRPACKYDWRPGSRHVLVCKICAKEHSVIRLISLDHDLLEDLFRRGMLTGTALEEASRGGR